MPRAESGSVPNMKLSSLLSWQLCSSPGSNVRLYMHGVLPTKEVHSSLGVHSGAPLHRQD